MGGSVQVNPMNLVDYGMNMISDYMNAMTTLNQPVGNIVEQTMTAFLTPPGGGVAPLAEAISVQRVVKRNLTEMQGFLGDVGTNVQAMQNAALAMAVAYMTTDNDASVNLSAVDFAFGDYDGKPPKGFPTKGVSTMEQQAQDSGAYSLASDAANSTPEGLQSVLATATGTKAVAGGTAYTFADGSVLVVGYTPGPDPYLGGYTTTLSVYKDGSLKSPGTVTSTKYTYDYSNQVTTTQTQSVTNPDGSTTSSTTAVTKLNDGSMEITTTTPGTDGKPQTQTVTVKPVTGDTKPDPNQEGEIQQLEDKYGAKGDPKHMKALGAS